uniref:C2H2-type domain-containing protein n=1 Tax=Strigamia maritima TaxID=126957 RepID=T1IQQ3_STRMM
MAFTCVACQSRFSLAEKHRDHYKTDWHRYNLKRKVAELPPIDEKEFNQRLLTHLERKAEPKAEGISICNVCKKHFSSTLTFENHLKSKKHVELAAKKPKINAEPKKTLDTAENIEIDDDDDDDEEWEDLADEPPLTVDECLFCSFKSDNVIENLKHMTTEHSFFVPDVEYLADLEGLIKYLAEKVSCGNMCLWCNEKGKAFHTTKSVQRHMLDKGHNKIYFESESLCEFVDFYDYSASHPDNNNENGDEEVDIDVLDDESYELVLPSGATIGHRSLMRYYKQNIPPPRSGQHRSKKLAPVLAHYRALGWSHTPQEVAQRNARDVKYLQNLRAKKLMQQGIRNNKLQKHIHTQKR